MKDEWKEVEFECLAKNKDGFDVPVKGVFKCRYGESVEAVLVSLKDENGRNVEVSAGERERIENDCAWHEYKNEYGSVVISNEKKAKVARELLKLAKMLVSDEDDDNE